MKHLFAFVGLIALPFAAQAEDIANHTLICQFTTECYETEECTFTDFTVDVALGNVPGDASLLPDTGPAEGKSDLIGDMLRVSAKDANGAYLLTRSPGGLAKLSVHYSGSHLMIAYDGQCRVAE
ncbi:MAG: hypothetical protein ACRBB0_14720 [Pelagimonas sp.]|uniref:hypothetical protein n=1 Tax=Pelagimonas sp. TaxID=2073170 RepID=UPI003D6BB888